MCGHHVYDSGMYVCSVQYVRPSTHASCVAVDANVFSVPVPNHHDILVLLYAHTIVVSKALPEGLLYFTRIM